MFLRSWKFSIGFILILFLIGMSLASVFFPMEETMNLSRSFESPSWTHPFGLDEYGRDVLRQTLTGARVSFLVSLSVVFISLIIGLIVGSISGYFGQTIDLVLMRVVDMVYAFPNFLLAMSLMAVLGSSMFTLILVMSLTTWASYARLVRGEVIHLKQKEFVLSVHSLGASFLRKMIRHIWPNILPILTVQITLTLAGVILTESGLSFLGVGINPDIPTWGTLLRSGRLSLVEAPHLSLFPGLSLFLLILGFHLLGDGLRETLSVHKN